MDSDTAQRIKANIDEAFPEADRVAMQVLMLAEEVGEFVGAFRRHYGLARRQGSHAEVAEELADVIIGAYVAAEYLDVSLDVEIEKKLARIFDRGWRDSSNVVIAE